MFPPRITTHLSVRYLSYSFYLSIFTFIPLNYQYFPSQAKNYLKKKDNIGFGFGTVNVVNMKALSKFYQKLKIMHTYEIINN